jgi:hypothetical protein
MQRLKEGDKKAAKTFEPYNQIITVDAGIYLTRKQAARHTPEFRLRGKTR